MPRLGLRHAGIGTWTAPLVVVCLAVVAFRLPCFSVPAEALERFGPPLPFAAHGAPALLAPVLDLDATGVTLDGRRVAGADEVAGGHVDLSDLEIVRRNWALLHDDAPWPGRVHLLVAPHTPWSHVRAVTMAAARAGAPHVAFAVESPAGDPPFGWARFAEP